MSKLKVLVFAASAVVVSSVGFASSASAQFSERGGYEYAPAYNPDQYRRGYQQQYVSPHNARKQEQILARNARKQEQINDRNARKQEQLNQRYGYQQRGYGYQPQSYGYTYEQPQYYRRPQSQYYYFE